jgi:hypothetical protein
MIWAPRRRRENFLQLGGEGKQRDVARPLDRLAQPALVARAGAGHAARQNFAAVLNKRPKLIGLLVINEINFVRAEAADLPLAEELALASAWRAAGSSTAFTRTSALTARAAGMRASSAPAGAIPTESSRWWRRCGRRSWSRCGRRSRRRCFCWRRSRGLWIVLISHGQFPFNLKTI